MKHVWLLLSLLIACAPGSRPDDGGDGWDDDTLPDGGSNPIRTPPPAPEDMPRPPNNVARADASCANGRLVMVERIIDGDTLELGDMVGGQFERVRLIGVNTPETYPEDAVECFGEEAKKHTRALVDDREACLTFDPAVEEESGSVDRYGRTLAYVWFGDDFERLLNAELVWGGWARDFPLTDGALYERYLRELRQAARSAGRGLWGACD